MRPPIQHLSYFRNWHRAAERGLSAFGCAPDLRVADGRKRTWRAHIERQRQGSISMSATGIEAVETRGQPMTESDPERAHRSRCVSVPNSSHPRADLGRDRAQKGPCLGPQDHRELPHAWYAAYPSIAVPSMKRLQTLLGDNPLTSALRRGEIASDRVAVDFVDHRPTNTGFNPMVCEGRFDVSEMAIVTYLTAKAHRKPMVHCAYIMSAPRSSSRHCPTDRGNWRQRRRSVLSAPG